MQLISLLPFVHRKQFVGFTAVVAVVAGVDACSWNFDFDREYE